MHFETVLLKFHATEVLQHLFGDMFVLNHVCCVGLAALFRLLVFISLKALMIFFNATKVRLEEIFKATKISSLVTFV